MYSWLWVKLKLCQYTFTMVTRRAQDQVEETLKQPYQTTVSREWLPCFSFMQQVTMKYAKKCNYLRKDSRLENGWHISHLCPYRHKCSTFLLHMQWYPSRVATDFVHKSWHIAGTAPINTFSKNIFPVYFTVICYAIAYLIQVSCYHNCLAVLYDLFITINLLMAMGRT